MKINYYFTRIKNIFKEGRNYTRNSSFPAGHYYSPIVELKEYNSENRKKESFEILGDIQLNVEKQLDLVKEFKQFSTQIPTWDSSSKERYDLNNGWYPSTDGRVLYSMIQKFQPKKIIEIGSGYSSALMLDVNETFFNNQIEFTFVEPNPDRLELLLREKDWKSATILKEFVQNVDLKEFESLKENDILLIDSSHVSKTDSDVNFLFFQVLPRLNSGVIIHIHDIFFPFEYPEEWILGGRNWNECYLLRAFLQNNSKYEIILFSDYLKQKHTEDFSEAIGEQNPLNGSSIYLKKK